MKKTLSLFVFVVTFATLAFSQSNKEEIDLYQAIFGMEKKTIVADFLKLEQNDPFWGIYDQYETERKIYDQKRIVIMSDYLKHYSTLSEEKATSIVKQSMKQKKQLDNLITKYYKKIYKINGAKVAAQFYQIENFFLSATRMKVSNTLPFIVNVK